MEEIIRFLQLRQVQKLSEEQKLQVGLSLYPDNKLSELAEQLKIASCDKEKYSEVIRSYEHTNDENKMIVSTKQIHPEILSLYQWLDFKSYPVKFKDFEDFVNSSKLLKQPDLIDEWRKIADNLILAIQNNKISTNYCIDFQLLIKACYIYKLCIGTKQNKPIAKGGENELNQILRFPILIPPLVLNSRCCASCSTKTDTTLQHSETGSLNPMRQANPCECKCNESCQQPSTHCICIKTYIADLFIIKEEIARYEEGDIADIENILSGEEKVRRHRSFMRTENTTEEEKETIASEERDHQVSEKFSLQEEVKSMVDSKVNIDAGVTSNLKYGESITLSPHANVASNSSKSEAENIARSYAKEVVDRSVSKLQEKVRKLQVSKIINELEERNKHSIKNTDPNADHKAGIYYWVNKVTHAQVFNYGRHMMFDVIIPEPAAIFKKLLTLKIEKTKAENEPKKPTETPASILRNNYGDILNKYDIATPDDCQPPDEFTTVQIAFSKDISTPKENKTMSFSSNEFKFPEVPKGYKANEMSFSISCSTGHPSRTGPGDEVAVAVHVGSFCIFFQQFNEYSGGGGQQNQNWKWKVPDPDITPPNKIIIMNGEEGILSITMAGITSLALFLSGTVSIKCDLKAEVFEKWQNKIYNLIMADYNRKLDAYKAGANKDDQLIQIKGRNPFLNREIERNEFKRHIVSILMCNYFKDIGSMMEKVAPCGYPEINFGKLEKDTPIIQFFEQVFEWNYLTYLFYHSMWARKCKWPELIDEDSGDPLFDKFLMSGAARVQIPIRPGMEDIFNWFLKTGQIWGASGVPLVSGDDDYVSMIQELKESKQCDYSDRPGLMDAITGNNILKLTNSTYYWDVVNDRINTLNITNDTDREILVNYKIYRIVKIEQDNPASNSVWNITLDRPYESATASNLKHAVGAVFVGAPWEIKIPTKLVYLRNNKDKLPVYPLI